MLVVSESQREVQANREGQIWMHQLLAVVIRLTLSCGVDSWFPSCCCNHRLLRSPGVNTHVMCLWPRWRPFIQCQAWRFRSPSRIPAPRPINASISHTLLVWAPWYLPLSTQPKTVSRPSAERSSASSLVESLLEESLPSVGRFAMLRSHKQELVAVGTESPRPPPLACQNLEP